MGHLGLNSTFKETWIQKSNLRWGPHCHAWGVGSGVFSSYVPAKRTVPSDISVGGVCSRSGVPPQRSPDQPNDPMRIRTQGPLSGGGGDGDRRACPIAYPTKMDSLEIQRGPSLREPEQGRATSLHVSECKGRVEMHRL
ncbi:hypothetical protein VNO77_02506 [Canavalia gladiata]|uniref:Uncharacterized protein n=1 Tax=Canavalia gladiata TaxID=3824 RepID=A0AAN9MV69_CANGL